MPVFISLLRGINVGGKQQIKMDALKSLYASLGLHGAQTLLQSGNVVFHSTEDNGLQRAAQLEAGIQQEFGFEVKIILRTRQQWHDVTHNPPFSAQQLADPAKALVMFLRSAPQPEAVAALVAGHSGSEIIYSRGEALYLYYPEGMGRSKLDHALIERRLKIVATGRNWNTVVKLRDLADSFGER